VFDLVFDSLRKCSASTRDHCKSVRTNATDKRITLRITEKELTLPICDNANALKFPQQQESPHVSLSLSRVLDANIEQPGAGSVANGP